MDIDDFADELVEKLREARLQNDLIYDPGSLITDAFEKVVDRLNDLTREVLKMRDSRPDAEDLLSSRSSYMQRLSDAGFYGSKAD